MHPIPPSDVIADYYENLNDGLSSDCSWATEPRHKIRLWTRLLQRVRQMAGDGPLLDLGCGAGQFLELALELGWRHAEGVEISAKAAAMARTRVAVSIREGAWQDVGLECDHYAAVALFDVLEHDAESAALLGRVFELLRPGGCLMLTVPNIRGISIRWWRAEAHVVIPPEHLAYYSTQSLAKMLARAGFVVEEEFTCDIYLKEWLRCLPARKAPEGVAPGAESRARYDRAYRRMTGRVALAGIGAVNTVLGLLGVGDQLVAIARKPLETGTRNP